MAPCFCKWPLIFVNFIYILLREGPLAHFDGPSLHKSRVFPVYVHAHSVMSVDAHALCKYIFRWLPRSKCFSVKHALCAPYAYFGMQSVQMELWTTTLLSHFNIDRYQVCAHECTFNNFWCIQCWSWQKFMKIWQNVYEGLNFSHVKFYHDISAQKAALRVEEAVDYDDRLSFSIIDHRLLAQNMQ